MRIRIYILAAFCLSQIHGEAQMRFGISDTLHPSAVVQIDTGEGTRKGLLMPRLSLKSTTNFYPLNEHVAGMVVYNMSQAGTAPNIVFPGHYYNDGTRWNRILSETDMTTIWLNATDGKPATKDTQNIYRMGKVGLGLTSPTEQLEVKGNVKVSNGSGNGSSTLKSGTTTGSGKLEFSNQSNTSIGSIGGDSTHIKYSSSDTFRHHVFIGGNIGVNTTTPLVKLEVNGAIKLGNEAATTTAPSAGMIRFNTTVGRFQGFNGTIWVDLNE